MRFGFQTREAEPAASPHQHHHRNNKEPGFTAIALDEDVTRPTQYSHSFPLPSKQPLLSQRSLESQGHDGFEQPPPPSKPWRPLMLRRWVLITFAIIFSLLLMSLEIILKVSMKSNGFRATGSKLYYVWTYGPTAGESRFLFAHSTQLTT
jgi:hypothetical protein